MDTEGIFRISGSNAKLTEYRNILDRGGTIRLSKEDEHEVTTLLKLWLRSLPNMLIPSSAYDHWTSQFLSSVPDASDVGANVAHMRLLVSQLSGPARAVLECVCMLFHDLIGHEKRTQMGARNLAIVLAPNILYQEATDVASMLKSK